LSGVGLSGVGSSGSGSVSRSVGVSVLTRARSYLVLPVNPPLVGTGGVALPTPPTLTPVAGIELTK
jgi:hypothetical protein